MTAVLLGKIFMTCLLTFFVSLLSIVVLHDENVPFSVVFVLVAALLASILGILFCAFAAIWLL